jgi:hypothetical protein
MRTNITAILFCLVTALPCFADTLWVGGPSGVWTDAGNWSPAIIPGIPQGNPPGSLGAQIDGSSTVTVQASFPVWYPGADFLWIGTGSKVIVSDVGRRDFLVTTTLNNAGEIQLGSATGTGMLLVGGGPSYPASIAGGGKITLYSGNGNSMQFGGQGNSLQTLLIADQTIQGAGDISGYVMTIGSPSIISGNSTFGALNMDRGSIQNTGILQASGGGSLQLGTAYGIDIANAGGTIRALDNSMVSLGRGSIVGGTLSSQGSGQVVGNTQNFTITDATLAGNFVIPSNAWLTMAGTVNNTGSVIMGGPGNESRLNVPAGGLTLTGGGAFTSLGNAKVDGFTNANNYMQGEFTVRGGTLVNQGTIQTN